MIQDWLGTSWTQFGLVVVSTVGIFAAVILAVRLTGLRSFAKMSSFDFAMTIAVGSLVATTAVSPSSSLANGVVAVAVLFALQAAIAFGRRAVGLDAVVDNTPMVLMVGAQYVEDNLRRGRITRSDVRAKLREANVLDYSMIRAVVLETTGDISVLHGSDPLDPDLLQGVLGVELLR